MCGIYAEVSWKNRIDEAAVIRCRDEMIHRGPDDAGLYVSPTRMVALAHRRLSIIDLSEDARQPLGNEDGAVQIVANGEIYNFRDLRRDLEGKGHVFRTGSDSEVLAHGYEEWGEQLPTRLDGMFAFAVWDERKKELFVCRDRFGIKPLYVWRDTSRVVVASDLSAIVAHPSFRRVVDGTGLGQYLCYGFVPSPRSIYVGVEKAAPAQWARFTADGRETSDTYWDFPRESRRSTLSSHAIADELDARLRSALESHLASDVPLGLLLSGGTDSTVLALLLRDRLPGSFSSFTIGYSDHARSEAEDAKVVAGLVGARHEQGEGSVPDTSALLDTLAETYTEPMSDTSAIGVLGLSEMTRRSVKVALGGDGGDEVFAGYPNIFRKIRPNGTLGDHVRLRLEQLVGGRTQQLLAFHRSRYRLWDWRDVNRAIPALRFGPEKQVEPLEPHFDPSVSRLRRLQRLEMRTFMTDMILAKVDRASMRHSLEVRVPMLDHHLSDFVFALPAKTVMPDRANKHLLRQWLAPRVPRAVLDKRKAGFGYPLDRDFDFTLARELVLGGALARAGWVEPGWLGSAWDAGVPRLANRRYQLACLESWLRRWPADDFAV